MQRKSVSNPSVMGLASEYIILYRICLAQTGLQLVYTIIYEILDALSRPRPPEPDAAPLAPAQVLAALHSCPCFGTGARIWQLGPDSRQLGPRKGGGGGKEEEEEVCLN